MFGQVVGIAEAFVAAGGADAAGEIQLRLHQVVPDPVARRLDLRVVFERGDVRHAGIHVHRADGVTDRLGLIDDLQLRLVVVEAARVHRLARREPCRARARR